MDLKNENKKHTEENYNNDNIINNNSNKKLNILISAIGVVIIVGISLIFYNQKQTEKRLNEMVLNMTTSLQRSEAMFAKSINQATIQFEDKLQIMEQLINNQTSILNRTIGKAIPIIIPDKFNQKLLQIKNKCNLDNPPATLSDYKKVEDLYKSYISTTPPWIQEEQYNDLLNIRYVLQFMKINLYYISNESSLDEIETLLSDLSEVIPANSNEVFISKVDKLLKQVKQDIDITEERTKDKSIKDLINKCNTILESSDKDISEDDINSLTSDLSNYENDSDAVKSKLEDLKSFYQNYIIAKETEELKNRFNEIISANKSDSWDIDKARHLLDILNGVHYEVDGLDSMKRKLDNAIDFYEIEIMLKNRKDKLKAIRQLSDTVSNSALPIFISECSSLILDLKNADFDTSEQVKETSNLISEAMTMQKEYEEELLKERHNKLSKYNSWAIDQIEDCKYMINKYQKETGWTGNDKEWYRKQLIYLMEKLLSINTDILIEEVRSLYYATYQNIMSDLEPKDKLIVAKKALYNVKKNLNDL